MINWKQSYCFVLNDINRAIERQQLFVADPETHTYEEDELDVEN